MEKCGYCGVCGKNVASAPRSQCGQWKEIGRCDVGTGITATDKKQFLHTRKPQRNITLKLIKLFLIVSTLINGSLKIEMY